MPLYEYSCRSCGRRFEELRPMAQREGARCPDCGAAAEKALSTFAAVTQSPCGSDDCGSGSGSCCSGGSCGCGG